MRRGIVFLVVMVPTIFLLLMSSAIGQQIVELSPIRGEVVKKSEPMDKDRYGTGDIPILYEIPKVKASKAVTKAPGDPSFTWEDYDGVTSVKNQGGAGTCWIFAGLGDLESKVKLAEAPATDPDYSEQDVGNCNIEGNYDGGNTFIVANHLSRFGTVDEGDEPYTQTQGSCNSNPHVMMAYDWRHLGDLNTAAPSDIQTIKNYLDANGPLATSMSVDRVLTWNSNFNVIGLYDGSTPVPYLTGASATDHGVVIVGWDDNKAYSGGTGCWRVKNSWSTSWGDGGYFWIAYGSALIGSNVSYYTQSGFDHYYTQTILHHDTYGWKGAASGYTSDYDQYGLAVYTPTFSGSRYLQYVAFWNRVPGATYEIRVYDGFDGSNLTSELTGAGNRPTGTCDSAGYFTAGLTTSIPLTSGNDIIIWLNLADPSNTDYILFPTEDSSGTSSGNTYLSWNGVNGSWSAMGSSDLCIRGIMSESATMVESWEVFK